MRATRWSLLVAVVVLVTACSSGLAQVAAPPEPPPAVPAVAPVAPFEAVPLPVPATSAVAPPVAEAPSAPAADDDPLPEGAAPLVARTGARTVARAAIAAPVGPPAATGRIEIPAIGLNHATFEGIDLATINYGPSHWPGKAQPGQVGNTVFPGHRTTFTRPFFDLDKLVPGNEVIFTTPAGRFTYRVTTTLIVGAKDTFVVNNTPDATFTLLACNPKGSARQRIVVKGSLVAAPVVTVQPAPVLTTTSTQRRRGLLGLF